nr:reverse transcriptase domain-containing protein [Tanacetum cinerariifolium]
MAEINKNLMRFLQVNQQVKAVPQNCETRGGPHPYCPTTVGNTQNVYAAGAYQGIKETIILKGITREGTNSSRELTKPQVVTTNEFTNFMKEKDVILKNMQTNMTSLTNSNLEIKNMFGQFMKMNAASSLGLETLPGNIITNPKEDLKGITTRRGTAYPGPTIPTTSSSPVVERETEATKETVRPANNRSTEDFQPSVVLSESLILNSEPVNSPIIEHVASPVSAPRPNLRPSILIHPERKIRSSFGPSIKCLLTKKDKLCELARTPLNEHCSAVLLKKLPKKLGDPGKFLIPCDFLGMAECLALADLGASINLMPLFVWNKLSLPDLYPTCMTLELTARSISRPVGVAEDVFVKVGTFHFPTDFVVVDFDADPRVPLILGRSFLKTRRSLIDVFEGELTLCVSKEAITFNLDQTSRYSANYNDMTANRIDVIDMACEEYSQEVLGFSDVIMSGNPTPYYDLIVSTTSPTLTPFGNNDFLLEEDDAFLALEDDPTSAGVDQSFLESKGDILLLEAFMNDDPSLPPPNQGNYLPEVRKELKIYETKSDKSSIDEPPEVELKDLPPHLEYTFLEGDDKLPVVIAKDLSMEEKTALITVLKSHKRAIAWKLSDIKGIDPDICTHKILMEEDFEPAVQHQRRVNPKIHDVIKQEVLKLLDAGLIYLISDSHWVSPVHCVPKKGGFTAVENEENELILTRLVTRWRVCIDYLFGNSFQSCLSYLKKMLKKCKDTNLCLNWEKSHFMVKDGIVLGQKISKEGIEVDKAKVDVITKLAHLTTVKGVYTARKPLTFSRLATMDPPGYTMAQITQPRRRLIQDFIGLPFTGIDFIGPFPSSRGNKYTLVAVDNLSKWVEVKALPINDARIVCKFLKNLFARFETPEPLSVIEEHTSVEVSNHGLKRILERTVGENRAFHLRLLLFLRGWKMNQRRQRTQSKSPILTSEPVNSPISEPVISPVSSPRPNLRPSISYPSRLQDQKLRDKANDQRE